MLVGSFLDWILSELDPEVWSTKGVGGQLVACLSSWTETAPGKSLEEPTSFSAPSTTGRLWGEVAAWSSQVLIEMCARHRSGASAASWDLRKAALGALI